MPTDPPRVAFLSSADDAPPAPEDVAPPLTTPDDPEAATRRSDPGSVESRVAASIEADMLDDAAAPKGDSLDTGDGSEAAILWNDPMDALLDPVSDELPTTFVNIVRRRSDDTIITAFKLEFRALPTGRVEALRKEYRYQRRDRRTGETVVHFKDREFRAQLIIESTVNLDWGSKELAKRYGTTDPHRLVESVLLSGEVERCSNAVYNISGGDASDGLEDMAGNS